MYERLYLEISKKGFKTDDEEDQEEDKNELVKGLKFKIIDEDEV
jgi:hypothetical protein